MDKSASKKRRLEALGAVLGKGGPQRPPVSASRPPPEKARPAPRASVPTPAPTPAPSAPRESDVAYRRLDSDALPVPVSRALAWPDARAGDPKPAPKPGPSITSRLATLFAASAPAPPGPAPLAVPDWLEKASCGPRGWDFMSGVLEGLMQGSMGEAKARTEMRSKIAERSLLLDNPVAALGSGPTPKRQTRRRLLRGRAAKAVAVGKGAGGEGGSPGWLAAGWAAPLQLRHAPFLAMRP